MLTNKQLAANHERMIDPPHCKYGHHGCSCTSKEGGPCYDEVLGQIAQGEKDKRRRTHYRVISYIPHRPAAQATIIAESPQDALDQVVPYCGCYITSVVFEDDQFADTPSGYPLLAWSGHAADYYRQEEKED